ncbi:MAG: nucleotide sugar dehydrogenase [Salibacteraceae bacterium]|nr:nucleotide sugar dehydrogenase [Salibacteraceae bacterium]|tara:strand:+ start:14367 stop:15662 length:1296 start_codon:yes stop_codon:yes gene_type:complete
MVLEKILNKESKIGIIGLGYVGLPIALEFARKVKVVGFDINAERVEMMKNNVDPSEELESKDFEGCDIMFTHKLEDLSDVNFFIVAVPTPIDEYNQPNLRPLLGASTTVGKVLKKGDYVVFESTVYPGCTEDDCIPVLEEHSGLKFIEDFKVGYSPERINPGDKEHTITKILKVVSGCDDESLDVISKIYELIIEPGVHRASSIKVAEAAKIIENTQRDLNIALMNELSIIFNRIGINTFEVLEAAGTKWNFLPFKPGLVGGHCIGVDPYYLTFKAEGVGYHARVINSGRYVNDSMGFYVAKQTVKQILAKGKNISGARILLMGATFKENVSDIRNSKICDVVKELQSFRVNVDVVDPHADSKELFKEYHFGLAENGITGKYDAVILAVNHDEYIALDENYFKGIMSEDGLFVDVKGVFQGKFKDLDYWSL